MNPNLCTSLDFAGVQQWVSLGGHRPTHLGARTSLSELVFPHKRALKQTEILFSFISWLVGLRWSCRWRSRRWRSWAGVVTCGLRLWGRLDVLPNSLKRRWRRVMVEKWTLNYLATALKENPAVNMPNAHSLETRDIYGIVMCDKTAHFRLAFYCPQHKMHLCIDDIV